MPAHHRPRRRTRLFWSLTIFAAAALAGIFLLSGSALAQAVDTPLFLPLVTNGSAGPELAGCPVFPRDNIWNTRVDHLPVHPRSAAYISSINTDPRRALHPDFGANWNGGPFGIPYTTVSGSQPRVPVTFEYDDESDPGPYPIPPDAPIEGGPNSSGDRHVLVLDRASCKLYELFDARPVNGGAAWTAGSGAIFDLRTHLLRPDGWTSADAAGLPILPGLVRYEEVLAGAIRHALRFTAQPTQSAYVWPARHEASSNTNPDVPPMGARFRLRASFNTSGFSPQVRVILEAMKTYGLILADNGSDWYISGVPDARWDDEILVSEFARVLGTDFEAVAADSLMLDPDTGQARQP